MAGRYGTNADVVMHSKTVERILSIADSAVSDDIPIGLYLGGSVRSDEKGSFFDIDRILSSSDGAIGLAVTSAEEGTEPAEADIASVSGLSHHGVLIVVDPYACEFSVFTVDDGQVCRADAVMVE